MLTMSIDFNVEIHHGKGLGPFPCKSHEREELGNDAVRRTVF